VIGAAAAGGLAEARTDEERGALLEAGRLLFARPCRFFHAAQQLDGLPPAGRRRSPSAAAPTSASRRW
jgi:hypothetical protein